MTINSVKPWKAGEECPLKGFSEFKKELDLASYHNAADQHGEWSKARECVRAAAEIAIDSGWPYWAMKRMFDEIGPLVAWDGFMQSYINLMHNGYHKEKAS